LNPQPKAVIRDMGYLRAGLDGLGPIYSMLSFNRSMQGGRECAADFGRYAAPSAEAHRPRRSPLA